MIVTFYSFKGGVGRSMALANIGRWFQLRGLDVVLVDWDLEAPGLESYFLAEAAQRKTVRGRMGLLDLIVTYKDLYPGLPQVGGDAFGALLDESLPSIAPLLVPLHDGSDSPGRLRMLTAGCRSEERFGDYAEAVQEFDWTGFYAGFQGAAYFEWLRRQLTTQAGADLVLVDSRTGVTEMSGVCTRQLADVVVTFCAPNDQNLQGVAMMADSFVRPDVLSARSQRPMELVMVPARIDVSEGRPVDVFEANFHAQLDRFLPPAFRRVGTGYERLRIPYISAYAFAERLAVGEPEGVKSMQEAYATIATHLALLAPASGALRRQCRAELQTAFGMPTVSVGSLADEGGRARAALCSRLEQAGVFTVSLPDGSPQAWLAAPGIVLLALGEEALRDGRIRPLWRLGRENAVCLHLVAAGTGPESPPPGWPRQARLWRIDEEREWSELMEELQRPCQALRVPFLAPPLPAQFVGRKAMLDEIKAWLTQESEPMGMLTLVGLGGIGKTSLACMLCHDDEVGDFFADGVLWLTLGAEAELRNGLIKLLLALGVPETELAAVDLEEARRRLTQLMSARRLLTVYDDVIDAAQLELLPRGGPLCRTLVTTRSVALASASSPSDVTVTVGPLEADAAWSLLVGGLLAPTPEDGQSLTSLMDRLGGLPLAITVANRLLRREAPTAQRRGRIAERLLAELDRTGLDGLDSPSRGSEGGSLLGSLNRALEGLDSADRARLPAMGALPASKWIELPEVAIVTRCTLEEATQTARRMHGVSLVEFDDARNAIRIHPLVHEFLRTLDIRQRRVENTRVVSRHAHGANSIYISYRRADAAGWARALYTQLAQEFGLDSVFMDLGSVSIGESFADVVASALARASAMVVVIGPGWLDARDPDGQRRLDNPDDFIRLEVAQALKAGLPVVPLLVGEAVMPRASDLPPDLAPLVRRQGIEVREGSFNAGIDVLIEALRNYAPMPTQPELATVAPMARPSAPMHHDPAPVAAREERVARGAAVSVQRGTKPAWLAVAAGGILVAAGLGYWMLRSPPPLNPPGVDNPQPQPGYVEFSHAEDLYLGRGMTRDVSAAVKLYRQAAEMGNASAQNSLGRLYETGDGVERNVLKAVTWYRKAADQGHPDARAALQRLQLLQQGAAKQ
ncbi:MAG TPA: NB-ARC domain-containing protein [Albitalea sp.]|uniref:KGGVGR-motif variant AAA ATPase n=1 Tax=Piscinibacter sp. TaxID=1903157 RepID=UPI002ECFC362